MWFEQKKLGGVVLGVLVGVGCVAIVAKQVGMLTWPWAWTLSPFWMIFILWLIVIVIANLDWKE
jgi:ABC-type antimicrobial peptide transport system permease subunit